MTEEKLLQILDESVRLQKEQSMREPPGELDSKWRFLTNKEPKKFIRPDFTIDREAIRNFRRDSIFIPDAPSYVSPHMQLKKWISGGLRGERRMIREGFDTAAAHGLLELLKNHPCNRVGNPNIGSRDGCNFTYRWLRHIFFMDTVKKFLGSRLKPDFTLLDIGSAYGIFPYIMKREFPGYHAVLLDFPEQMLLAHYYLGSSYPQAKIAGYKEVAEAVTIDRKFIEQYDFVLLPWFLYKKLAKDSVDLYANFMSFGEMRREWFDFYLKSEPFLSCRYFYCVNHVQSNTTYDTDLTVLDYPLDQFQRLLFRVYPYFSHVYQKNKLFFYKRVNISPHFEFVGERR